MYSNSRAFGAPVSAALKLGAIGLTVFALAACGSASPGPSGTPTQPTGVTSQSSAQTLVISDAWAKAASQSDEHAMTGIFGQIHNPTDHAISITSATTDVAEMVELHETVMDATGNTVMAAVEAGFEIAPGGSLVLQPGEEHVMLMGLTQDLIAGDQVSFTLSLSDGNELAVTAEIRDYKGAQETYSHEETESSSTGSHGTDQDHVSGH